MVAEPRYLQYFLTQAKLKTQDNLGLLLVDKETQNGRSVIKAWKNAKSGPLDNVLSDPDHKFLLRPDRANHIIIYPGAFNPPHRGHIDTLLDGFKNSGPGLNIVATIVAPTGDNELRAKEATRRAKGEPATQVMLDQRQREDLLRGGLASLTGLASHTKVWTFPGLDPFKGYLEVVKNLALAEGYAIEFLSLKGPDHLVFDRPILYPTYPNCRKIIFTEATRRMDKEAWQQDGRPRNLKGGWKPWSCIGRIHAAGREGVVWRSTIEGAGDCEVRLLTDPDRTGKLETSSTKIRNLMTDPQKKKDRKSLDEELEKAGAFCIDMLLEFHEDNTKTGNTHSGSIQRGNTQTGNTQSAKTQSGNVQVAPRSGNTQPEKVQRANTDAGSTHGRKIVQPSKKKTL
ncbi:hypothetical protein KVR01_007734 [Diaporthe batatas]|uniref:uncharacterized protein n=1 Tax=Diaporthe batatas TaxID=748121 RepID=UPI001D054C9B|nr:uncharacterized protein KVR01_007734 [Diaporthe batatas]KAG8161969.1 hypothetical protein KVR01_007734 [Diaporthe batatas]